MNTSRDPVRLLESDSKFLLFTPPSMKERAKSILGWWWNPEMKHWEYPKTARMYDALIAEFGDDMVACTVQRPSSPSVPLQTTSLQEENHELRKEVGTIHKTLELLSERSNNGTRSELQALEAALVARQNELSEVRTRLLEREREIEYLRPALGAVQAEVERLQSANATFQAELLTKRQGTDDPASTLERLVKDLAKDATGRDSKFVTLIDRLLLNDLLPNEIVKQLERELRRSLATDGRGQSVSDLITSTASILVYPN
jgi:hypothetical protein